MRCVVFQLGQVGIATEGIVLGSRETLVRKLVMLGVLVSDVRSARRSCGDGECIEIDLRAGEKLKNSYTLFIGRNAEFPIVAELMGLKLKMRKKFKAGRVKLSDKLGSRLGDGP